MPRTIAKVRTIRFPSNQRLFRAERFRALVVPDFLAVVALGLLSLGAFWQVIFTNAYSLLSFPDDSDQSYAWYQFLAGSLAAHRLPLWDPYTFAGHPFVGEIQGGAFYPPNIALALLTNGGTVSSHSIELLLLAHLFAGACFTYALGRYLGLSLAPAFVAAIAFAFGGTVLGRIQGQANLFAGLVWLPLAALCLEAGLRKRSLALGMLGGAVAALGLLAGHFEPAYHTILVLGILTAWHAYREPSWRQKIQIGAVGAVSLVGFAGAGAVQLLPTLEYSHYALQYVFSGPPLPAYDRLPYDVVSTFSVRPTQLLSLIVPQVAVPPDISPYLGVGVLGLAIAAAVWPEHKWTGFLVIVGMVGVLTALGNGSILHGWEYALIPGSDRVREADRRFYLFHFAAALLAGLGTQALVGSPKGPRYDRLHRFARAGLVPLAIGVLGFVAFVAISTAQANGNAALAADAILHSVLVGAAVVAACAAIATNRLSARAGATILVLACAWDLLSAGDLNAQPITGFDGKGNRYPELWYAPNAITRYLQAHADDGRVEVISEQLPRNVGDAFRFSSTFGHTATILDYYLAYYGADGNPRSVFNRMLGVRYYVSDKPWSWDPALITSGSLSVFPTDNAMPRAWLVHRVSVAAEPSAAIDLLQMATFDPNKQAVVDRAPAPNDLANGEFAGDRVAVIDSDPVQPTYFADVAAPALLVAGDVYYPGWVAYVDGHPAEVMRVNIALRGVYLPTGSHVVTFAYIPASFKRGLALTYVTLALLIAAGVTRLFWRDAPVHKHLLQWLAVTFVLVAFGFAARQIFDPLGERTPQTPRQALSLVDRLATAHLVPANGNVPPIGTRDVNTQGETTRAILLHAASSATYHVTVPESGRLLFSTGIDSACQGVSDGARFTVTARDTNGEQVVFDRDSSAEPPPGRTAWQATSVDLSKFAGHSIDLTLATGPGQRGDFACDWAEWGEPIVVGD
jgi:hypothetical protein